MYKLSEFTKNAYKTGEVAKYLSVHVETIKRWDTEGKLSMHRTEKNRRYMFKDELLAILKERGLLIDDLNAVKHDILYCRVSSNDQKVKGDLDRQLATITQYAAQHGLQNPLILMEVGSGLNDNRRKLQKLLRLVLKKRVNRIFINYKDRLTRFGFRYLQTVCEECGVEIVVVSDEKDDKSVQEEMVEDMMSLIACFSGKLYGMRSKQKRELLKKIDQIPSE
jgi:excisionase family DNA binding protein